MLILPAKMPEENVQDTFQRLRLKHPRFYYHGFEVRRKSGQVSMHWEFEMEPHIRFQPSMTFIPPEHAPFLSLDRSTMDHLAFHLGMIELISYWKSACPPEIIIKPFSLPEPAAEFWADTYFNGLGEFRYLNHIDVNKEEFFSIRFEGGPVPSILVHPTQGRTLLPVGGGKDSSVSLWLIKNHHPDHELIPFMVNSDPASLRTLKAAGISEEKSIHVSRKIDHALLELNQQGYLNGHTPFSALLAFAAHTAACLTGCHDIILSNEASANESTIPGTSINHQYSKTVFFEEGFRTYLGDISDSPVRYFSLLRPLYELQIAAIFSRLKVFHPSFRSCNAGSKQDIWCGKCAKCLFTAVMLAPFLGDNEISRIIGCHILDDIALVTLLNDLAGWSEQKPFECVGTVDEVRKALSLACARRLPGELPSLLRYAANKLANVPAFNLNNEIKLASGRHFVPEPFLSSLTSVLDSSIQYHNSKQ